MLPECLEVCDYTEAVLAKQYDDIDLLRLLELVMIFENIGLPEWRAQASGVAEIVILHSVHRRK